MSGGSMNYLYSRLEQDADFELNTPERIAFAKHLELVAKALHDIEWVDSADYGPGDDVEAIKACSPPLDVLDELRKLKALVTALEAERDYWRNECSDERAALGIKKLYWDGTRMVDAN